MNLDLCICTYQRAHVAETLRSVAAMEIPADVHVRILVADNDAEPSAQTLVASVAETLGLDVMYLHAPAQNISIARNACLDAATAEYLAFIDDDERLSAHWLSAMVAQIQKNTSDILLGPVQAIYPANAPAWLMAGDFHSTKPVWESGIIRTGYAGNVMMRRSAIAQLRFDETLGVSGGEDTDFFTRATRTGARIGFAAEALVYELIPPERCSLRWLIRRRARFGQTHARMMDDTKLKKLHGIVALGKAAVSFAMVPITLLFPTLWRFWMLRGVFHASVARALFQSS